MDGLFHGKSENVRTGGTPHGLDTSILFYFNPGHQKSRKKWWYRFFTAWQIGILTYPCHCCPKKLAVKIFVFIGSLFFYPYVLYNMYLQDWELPEKNRDFSAEHLGLNLLIWCLLGVWCPLGVFHNPVMKMVWWWWITLKDIISLSYSDDGAMISPFCCHDSCVLHNVHRFFWKPKWWEQSSQLAFLWDLVYGSSVERRVPYLGVPELSTNNVHHPKTCPRLTLLLVPLYGASPSWWPSSSGGPVDPIGLWSSGTTGSAKLGWVENQKKDAMDGDVV